MAPTTSKKVDDKKSEAKAKTDNKTEPVQNHGLDNFPPGASNNIERGVPNRNANDRKANAVASTGTPSTSVKDSVKEPEDVQIVQQIPYTPPNPLKEARKSAIAKRGEATEETKPKSREKSNSTISARALAHVIRTASAADSSTALELNNFLHSSGVNPEQIREAQELIKAHPELFVGDQKPGNLQVLGSLPGAQKPPEFEAAPGTNMIPDNRYYPTRYPFIPEADNFEDADLVYYVHEDGTYTVLSVYQQSREWQTANHLPPMNLIMRIGGDVEDTPKELKGRGLMDRKEISEEYDKETAAAK